MGDSVPEVITTVWYFANTGRIARLASRQASWITGSGTCRRQHMVEVGARGGGGG